MGKRKCGCVYADAKNSPGVRSGHELGGYLKSRCLKHQREFDEQARHLLEEVMNDGLIYWEPSTNRGHIAKDTMLRRIDDFIAALTTQPEPTRGQSDAEL